MALVYDPSRTFLEGQNIRPPRGLFFNGQSYWIKVHPELGNSDRSIMVVKMVLQFQYQDDGPGGKWTHSEKDAFAHGFVDNVVAVWSEKHRITTTSTVPTKALRDVGVVFEFPYYIDGWHTDDDFELSVKKYPADAEMATSSCSYSWGNTTLDSNDLRGENKGATMKQRGAVHEFGHMLGLRDEYSGAKVDPNKNHLGDLDSIMNVGEIIRERHYAPFADWLTEKFAVAAHLSRSEINYKVNGNTNMANAAL